MAWIEGSQATIDLNLNDALKLHREGVPSEVIAAMVRVPAEQVESLFVSMPEHVGERTGERTGLSRRQILRMHREGTPEAEILKAIEEQGSNASLSLNEALRLQQQGVSPALLAAMLGAGAIAPPASPVAPVAPAGKAGSTPATVRPTPTLDEVLPPAPENDLPTLDQVVSGATPKVEEEQPEAEEKETEEPAPTLEEALGNEQEEAEEPGEAKTYFFALSDPGGAKLLIAPSSTRIVDLLKQAKGAGRTPAQIVLDPGAWFLLVEKRLDDFDAALIPAIHTLLDGEGRTRTLIESGDVYYDAQDCCLPKSLTGALSIARISEDQQGTILGDEFGGLPPYLWDGNRYLILSVHEGKIRRAIKVYEVRKAIGESRTLTATFIPTSAPDPLAPRESPAAETMDEVETRARETWTAPNPAEMRGIAKIYSIGGDDLAKIAPALTAAGKAIWRHVADDGSFTIVALSLDSGSRVRAEEYFYRKDGPFGMLSTPSPPPPPRKKRKNPAPPAAPPPPLAELTRHLDPETLLPVLSISNDTKIPVLVRIWDGILIVVPPGETRETMVSPGSGEIVARSADSPSEKRRVKAHFTYHARYVLHVD